MARFDNGGITHGSLDSNDTSWHVLTMVASRMALLTAMTLRGCSTTTASLLNIQQKHSSAMPEIMNMYLDNETNRQTRTQRETHTTCSISL